MPTRRRALLVLAVLALLALGSVILSLAVGSLALGFGEVLAALAGEGGGVGGEVVRGLRLPRALGAFACGGLLALAGALTAMLAGLALALVNLAAFAGAFLAMLLVFGLAHGDSSWTRTRLLLTGVIVAAGCGAVVALILTVAPQQQLHGMLYWLMGDASQIANPCPPLIVLALGLAAALPYARELNLLARGEVLAGSLGVEVLRLKRAIYALASLLTAVAVTTAGSIGFVGLVVPHLVRIVVGSDHRLLLPAATLVGGSLLLLADTLARTAVAPLQLPVGVLTALIGVPVFLFLLARQPGSRA